MIDADPAEEVAAGGDNWLLRGFHANMALIFLIHT